MGEEREGEEEVNFEELRPLIEELEIKIWRLRRRWWERKRKGLMMEKPKEYLLHQLEDILHQIHRLTDILQIIWIEFTTGKEVRLLMEKLERGEVLRPFMEKFMEKLERDEVLHPLMEKLERGEVLNADEVASLMRIEEFACSKGREELLREVERAFTKLGELTKNIAAEPEKMELKRGEIKEIDENTLIRRRKDGKLELILL